MHLQALVLRFQSDLLGDRARVPFHEGRIDIKDLVTVEAYHLRLFCRLSVVGDIELVVAPNIDFTNQAALRQDR